MTDTHRFNPDLVLPPIPGIPQNCPKCKNTGWYWWIYRSPCPYCGGLGYESGPRSGKPCKTCQGLGHAVGDPNLVCTVCHTTGLRMRKRRKCRKGCILNARWRKCDECDRVRGMPGARREESKCVIL